MHISSIKKGIVLVLALVMIPTSQLRPTQDWRLLALIGAGVSGIALAGKSLYQWLSPSNETLISRAHADFANHSTYQIALQRVRDAYNISDQCLIDNDWIIHTPYEPLLYELCIVIWQRWTSVRAYRAHLQAYITIVHGHVSTLQKCVNSLEKSRTLTTQEVNELREMRILTENMAALQKELQALSRYLNCYDDYFELAEQSWHLDYHYKKEFEALETYGYNRKHLRQEIKTVACDKYINNYYVALKYTQQLDTDIAELTRLIARGENQYSNLKQWAVQLLHKLRVLRGAVDMWYQKERLSYERELLAYEQAALARRERQQLLKEISYAIQAVSAVPVTKIEQHIHHNTVVKVGTSLSSADNNGTFEPTKRMPDTTTSLSSKDDVGGCVESTKRVQDLHDDDNVERVEPSESVAYHMNNLFV